MNNEKIYNMSFSKVYECLLNKVERKARTKEELNCLINWLLGYSSEEIEELLIQDVTYQTFFLDAPCLNPNRHLITGSICGIKLSEIEEPLMQDIRYLDKLVDELAKGKQIEKILRK